MKTNVLKINYIYKNYDADLGSEWILEVTSDDSEIDGYRCATDVWDMPVGTPGLRDALANAAGWILFDEFGITPDDLSVFRPK